MAEKMAAIEAEVQELQEDMEIVKRALRSLGVEADWEVLRAGLMR